MNIIPRFIMEGPMLPETQGYGPGRKGRLVTPPSSDPWDWPAELPGKVYIPTYDEEYKIKELLK